MKLKIRAWTSSLLYIALMVISLGYFQQQKKSNISVHASHIRYRQMKLGIYPKVFNYLEKGTVLSAKIFSFYLFNFFQKLFISEVTLQVFSWIYCFSQCFYKPVWSLFYNHCHCFSYTLKHLMFWRWIETENGLMNFFVVEWEFPTNFNNLPRINSHFSGYRFFQTFSISENSWYCNTTLRGWYREGMVSSSEVSFSSSLMLFPESFFSDQPTRFLEIVRLHDMRCCWILSNAGDICLLFIQVKTRSS